MRSLLLGGGWALFGLLGVALAQEGAPALDAQEEGLGIAPAMRDASDPTGTDPLVFAKRLGFSNTYQAMVSETYRNVIAVDLDFPLDADWLLGVQLPYVLTDQFDGMNSVGELTAGLTWAVQRGDRFGWSLGTDVILDTISERVGGRGRNIVAPSIRLVWYLGENVILTPSYSHLVGVSGHEWRPEINEGRFALACIWRAADGEGWLTLEPSGIVDLEGEQEFVAVSLELGRVLGSYEGEPVTGFVRPSVGTSSAETVDAVGADYPYDYAVAVGLRLRFR